MNEKTNKSIKLFIIIITIYFGIKLIDTLMSSIKTVFSLIFPIILSFIISFILNPLKQKLLNKKLKNLSSTVITFSIFLIVLVLIMIVIIPNLIKELNYFIDNIPKILNLLEKLYQSKIANKFKGFGINVFSQDIIYENINLISKGIIDFLQMIISYTIDLFIAVFVAFYFLYDYDRIINFLKEKIKASQSFRLYNCLVEIKNMLYTFIKGVIFSNFILFLLATITFLLIGLDYSLPLGLILALTNIIPYIGPYIGGSFAVIIGLNISNKMAIYAFLSVICLQFIDNYILSPKIQSSTIKLKPVIIIISVFIIGKIFGIFGMILAVPITSIFQIIYKFYLSND